MVSPLGIIAGGGMLPAYLVDACRQRGCPVFVLAFKGDTDLTPLVEVEHAFVSPGEVGRAIELLRQAGVSQLVMAGPMKRPSLKDLRPDAKGAKLLARLGPALLAGDDRLLSAIVKFFEEEGFEVLGAEEVLGGLLAKEGPLGRHRPDAQDEADILLGVKVVRRLGELDIGQAVIVQHGHVLGVEAAEGTDKLIERCVPLKLEGPGGVLVKASKPGQERRTDLPAIGPQTVYHIAQAGFAGIAVEAGHALILDRDAVISEADKAGIFVIGVTADA